MESKIRIGRIFGIEIGLHYSWFIIAFLIATSLADHFHHTNPEWGSALIWGLALLTALLFFGALLVHELSHAIVAKRNQLPVHSITLFALGGVAQITKEAENARTEFWMGLIGPITSSLIGLLFLALSVALGWKPMGPTNTPLLAMFVWLGYINLILALFNLIPGFPLDGGRVLRAVIWWITGNRQKSTRIAARIGQIVALVFISIGILRFFSGNGFGGLWIAFIGWFLLQAAGSTYAEVEIAAKLRGSRVADVMSVECGMVEPSLSVDNFVHNFLLRTGRRCFVVAKGDQVVGLITPHEVKNVDKEKWPSTSVEEAMVPLQKLKTISPEAPLRNALESMAQNDINQLPVISDGHFKGIISRDQIVRFLQTKAELHV